MAACPKCASELPVGYASVCGKCGFVVRVPGVVKLAITLLGAGFALAIVWALGADAVFAGLWRFLDGILVRPLGLRPAAFELTGFLKVLYDFVFGTATEPPWGAVLLIAAGLATGAASGALLRRAESRGAAAA